MSTSSVRLIIVMLSVSIVFVQFARFPLSGVLSLERKQTEDKQKKRKKVKNWM